jgi:hypothetical protein
VSRRESRRLGHAGDWCDGFTSSGSTSRGTPSEASRRSRRLCAAIPKHPGPDDVGESRFTEILHKCPRRVPGRRGPGTGTIGEPRKLRLVGTAERTRRNDRWRTGRPPALADFQCQCRAGTARIYGRATVPVLAHYARVAWINAPLDAEINVGIRAGGEEIASEGAGEGSASSWRAPPGRALAAGSTASSSCQRKQIVRRPWFPPRRHERALGGRKQERGFPRLHDFLFEVERMGTGTSAASTGCGARSTTAWWRSVGSRMPNRSSGRRGLRPRVRPNGPRSPCAMSLAFRALAKQAAFGHCAVRLGERVVRATRQARQVSKKRRWPKRWRPP